jgi:hypothetical protein
MVIMAAVDPTGTISILGEASIILYVWLWKLADEHMDCKSAYRLDLEEIVIRESPSV